MATAGFSSFDLIQEGNVGLMKGVETSSSIAVATSFPPMRRGGIRQSITRAIADQARTIRLRCNMVEIVNKLTRVSRQLVQEFGREPTSLEIAKRMDIPPAPSCAGAQDYAGTDLARDADW